MNCRFDIETAGVSAPQGTAASFPADNLVVPPAGRLTGKQVIMRNRKVFEISGHEVRFDCHDDDILEKVGAVRISDTKDIVEMDGNPETVMEKALAKAFPGGYNNTGDRYFIISKDGFQYLVLEHAGQWFVGDNFVNEKTGHLMNISLDDKVKQFLVRYCYIRTDDMAVEKQMSEDLLEDVMDFIETLRFPEDDALLALVANYEETCGPLAGHEHSALVAAKNVLKEAMRFLTASTGYEFDEKERFMFDFSPAYNSAMSERYGLTVFNAENPSSPYYVAEWAACFSENEIAHPETIDWMHVCPDDDLVPACLYSSTEE